MTMIPRVHRGGTSKATLLDANESACDAVSAAMRALEEASPNARDFYLQSDPLAFSKALREHVERMAALQRVHNELMTIIEGVVRQ